MKKLIVFALFIAMIAGLVSCTQDDTDFLRNYLQGSLDSIYKGIHSKEYKEAIGNLNEFELNEAFLEGMGYEADYFASYFQMEMLPPAIREELIPFYTSVYSKAKYEVGTISKSGDNYTAELTIYPIDLIVNYVESDEFYAYVEKFNEEYADVDMEVEEFETIWATGILNDLKKRLPELGYLEPQTIAILMQKDSEGYYFINEPDMNRIDELMIAY